MNKLDLIKQPSDFLVTLATSEQKVVVKSGESLLSALLRHGIIFPYSCQSGDCGKCKCKLICGDVRLDIYSETALSGMDFKQGYILACRAKLFSDITIVCL